MSLWALHLCGKITQNGEKTRHHRKQGALKAQRKLTPRASEARLNRYKGALKVQLHIARGETPGNGIDIIYSAPCKGSYIKI
jgi:hypothetical protein